MIDERTPNVTTMTLYTKYEEYSITVYRGDLPLGDIITSVVRPLLLAAGYGEQIIDEYLGPEFDGDDESDGEGNLIGTGV